jgi:hypothetical protein
MNIPDYISESFETICLKILEFFDEDPEPESFRPWIQDRKKFGSATLGVAHKKHKQKNTVHTLGSLQVADTTATRAGSRNRASREFILFMSEMVDSSVSNNPSRRSEAIMKMERGLVWKFNPPPPRRPSPFPSWRSSS